MSNKQSVKKKRARQTTALEPPPQADSKPKKATVYLSPEQNLALEEIRFNYLAKYHQRLDKQDLILLGVDLAIAKYKEEPPQPPEAQ